MFSANDQAVSQYTDQVEEQHAYIKETVDTIFPSNIRVLQVNLFLWVVLYKEKNQHDRQKKVILMWMVLWIQGVLDKIRLKIQKLEKAILSQNEQCRDPCITKCPIPVVSGEWGRQNVFHKEKNSGWQNYLWFSLITSLRCDPGKECEDIYRRGGRDSQMYLIQPDPLFPPYKVFCDQTSQNGG